MASDKNCSSILSTCIPCRCSMDSHKSARQKILSGCENKLLDYQSLNLGCGGEETLVKETTIDVLLGNLPSENGLI